MTPENALSAAPHRDVVVFVHGFGSSPRCWDRLLDLLRRDSRVTASFDLKCFEYPTSWATFSLLRRIPSLGEVARSLQAFLESPRLGTYREVTLVGHSLGGLVIQRYLADKVQQGRAEDLARIRQVILIATPNLGSELLSPVRNFFSHFFFNPQERTLRIFDPEISEIRTVVSERIVDASIRTANAWPIPVQCFWGSQDRVVVEASARGPFDSENAMPLDGDHFSVIQPADARDENYERIVDALLKPTGHRCVWEIDLYDTMVRVEPLPGVKDFVVKYGDQTRTVTTDNVAHAVREVTFSRKNRCREPFTLRYATKNDGYVKPAMSHENEAPPQELARYEERGTEAIFKFSPRAGETYSLKVDVYKGFDERHRDIHFHMGTDKYYKRFRFRLDLTAYVASGWSVVAGPKLYLHERDPKDHKLCDARELRNEIPCVDAREPGRWEWELRSVTDGVIDVVWDVKAGPTAVEVGQAQSA
jgi:pimeloyl-ACP methyl ester carboxylesterase